MYEEVPRTRRRLSRLTASRVALGPFVVGGGVLMATLGGSVALAATAITARTIAVHQNTENSAARIGTPRPATASASARPNPVGRGGGLIISPPGRSPAHVGGGSGPGGGTPAPTAVRSAPASGGPAPSPTPSAGLSSSPVPPTSAPAGSPSGSLSGLPGNALVFVTGYDSGNDRLMFRYATVSVGTGPGNSDVYSAAGSTTFQAGLASDLTVLSGGTICPPEGNSCTAAELVAAASDGFFAEIAVDPSGYLHSVIERDNVRYGAGPAPSASPSASPSGSTATPVAGPSPSPS